MSNIHQDNYTYDESLINLSRNFIRSCSSGGIEFNQMKDILDNVFNIPTNLILSMLNDETNENNYQKEIKSIRIPMLQKLAQEILKYKLQSSKSRNISINNLNSFDESNPQYNLMQKIQISIIELANQSKSQKVKSIADSIDKNHLDLSRIDGLLQVMIEDNCKVTKSNNLQREMAILCSKLSKNNDKKVDESSPVEKSEKYILDSFKELNDEINYLKEQALNERNFKDKLINTLKSQIGVLKNALKEKNENQAFQQDMQKCFKNIENNLNCNKYNELFNNYIETLDKIEEINKSKNDLLIKNGSLQTEKNLLEELANELKLENKKQREEIVDLIIKLDKQNEQSLVNTDFQVFDNLKNNNKPQLIDLLKTENEELKRKLIEIQNKCSEYKENYKKIKNLQNENEELKKQLSDLQILKLNHITIN